MGAADILVASALLYGTMKRDPDCLMPFLVFIPLSIIVDWIILLLFADILFSLLAMVLMTLIYVYSWVCVFSFRDLLSVGFSEDYNREGGIAMPVHVQ